MLLRNTCMMCKHSARLWHAVLLIATCACSKAKGKDGDIEELQTDSLVLYADTTNHLIMDNEVQDSEKRCVTKTTETELRWAQRMYKAANQRGCSAGEDIEFFDSTLDGRKNSSAYNGSAWEAASDTSQMEAEIEKPGDYKNSEDFIGNNEISEAINHTALHEKEETDKPDEQHIDVTPGDTTTQPGFSTLINRSGGQLAAKKSRRSLSTEIRRALMRTGMWIGESSLRLATAAAGVFTASVYAGHLLNTLSSNRLPFAPHIAGTVVATSLGLFALAIASSRLIIVPLTEDDSVNYERLISAAKIVENLEPLTEVAPPLPADLGCAICLQIIPAEEAQTGVVLPCGHAFHRECVDTWLRNEPVCPICRTDLAEREEPF